MEGVQSTWNFLLLNVNFVDFNMFPNKWGCNFFKIQLYVNWEKCLLQEKVLPSPAATCLAMERGFPWTISSVFITTFRRQWACICNTFSYHTEHHILSIFDTNSIYLDFFIKKHLFMICTWMGAMFWLNKGLHWVSQDSIAW